MPAKARDVWGKSDQPVAIRCRVCTADIKLATRKKHQHFGHLQCHVIVASRYTIDDPRHQPELLAV